MVAAKFISGSLFLWTRGTVGLLCYIFSVGGTEEQALERREKELVTRDDAERFEKSNSYGLVQNNELF